jgi:putative spermidine/putrescine transport system substrate-binding protein
MKYKVVFCVVIVTVLTILSCRNKSKTNEVVFCSWGGEYQKAQREAYLNSFNEKYKIDVKEATYSGELAKIKGMIDAHKVEWDIVSVTQELFSTGAKEDFFEPLDYSIIDTSKLLKGTVKKFGVAHLIFSTPLAYNTTYFKTNKRPQNWKEFWDIHGFPGSRSLRDSPIGNLEFALLADGVSIDSLYPIDVNRAFKKLTELKPFIKVWWTQGQQPIQLLSSGEVDLSTCFNGRLAKAQKDGEPVAIEWNGGMMEPEYFVVIKGAPNIKNAFSLINFALQSTQQSKFVKLISYGPTNSDVFNNLTEELKSELPDSPQNIAGQFLINGEWWSNNYEKMVDRWNEWKIAK